MKDELVTPVASLLVRRNIVYNTTFVIDSMNYVHLKQPIFSRT